jgi:hypothetical protein
MRGTLIDMYVVRQIWLERDTYSVLSFFFYCLINSSFEGQDSKRYYYFNVNERDAKQNTYTAATA